MVRSEKTLEVLDYTLIKSQIEALNGKINVESILHEGTIFTLTFKR